MDQFNLREYLKNNPLLKEEIGEGELYKSEYFDAYHEAGDKLENHPNYKKLVSILKDRGFEPDGTPYSDGTGRRDVHGVWDVFKSYTTEPGSRGTTLTKANAKDINDALRQAGIQDIEAKPSNSYSFRLKINNLDENNPLLKESIEFIDYVTVDQDKFKAQYDKHYDDYGDDEEFIEEFGGDFLSPNIDAINQYYGAKVYADDVIDDFFMAGGKNNISSNEKFEAWLDKNREFYL